MLFVIYNLFSGKGHLCILCTTGVLELNVGELHVSTYHAETISDTYV
jgi:hypothetical protein